MVHLRWLPLDLSDSASEMGNIVEFASTGGRLGGGRVPERFPCGGGAGGVGWGGVARKAGLLAACLLAPVGDIDFFCSAWLLSQEIELPRSHASFS